MLTFCASSVNKQRHQRASIRSEPVDLSPIQKSIVTSTASSSCVVLTFSQQLPASLIILLFRGRISAWKPRMPLFLACSTRHFCSALPTPVLCQAGSTRRAFMLRFGAQLPGNRVLPKIKNFLIPFSESLLESLYVVEKARSG